MSFEVLARMTDAALRGSSQHVEFMWHGGEPTILPIRFYEKALLLQAHLRKPGQSISNSLQTNGTLITAEWAKFLRENAFDVGVSLDGPPRLHDGSRRSLGGRASYADVVRGIHQLKAEGVPFGVLMVVEDYAIELGAGEVFSFFVDMDIKRIGLIAAKPTNCADAVPGTPTDHYVEPQRMVRFLIELYECWREHGDPSVRIRELSGIADRIGGGRRGPCTMMGGCFGQYFTVEPNGDISHCDLFVGDDRYTLGNVLAGDFDQACTSNALAALKAENASRLRSLQTCKYFKICNGWCPHEYYLSYRHNRDHNSTCCGLAPLIDHMITNEMQVI